MFIARKENIKEHMCIRGVSESACDHIMHHYMSGVSIYRYTHTMIIVMWFMCRLVFVSSK